MVALQLVSVCPILDTTQHQTKTVTCLCLLIVSGIFIVNILFKIYADIDCDNNYACALKTINVTSNEDINCHGYHSCYGSSLITNGNGYIDCAASYSCYKANTIQVLATDGVYPIYCRGLFSCSLANLLKNIDGDIDCSAEQSCVMSNIYVSNPFRYLYCSGDHSCANSIIYNTNKIVAYGSLSLHNSMIVTRDSTTGYSDYSDYYFYFYGSYSGMNTTIICDKNNIVCNIFCFSNGCNGLMITTCKYDNVNDCNVSINIDCQHSERNDICSDSTLSYNPLVILPNLANVSMSTYENSYMACDSATTNAWNIDDNTEYEYSNTLDYSIYQRPICCTGRRCCWWIQNIITDCGDINEYKVSIRCDSSYACRAFTSIIDESGGNMYMAGYHGGAGSNYISTTEWYNIYCTGYAACAGFTTDC